MNESTITLDGVSLVYPDGDSDLTVLDHVDLELRAGEMLALVGPSGSGKSSLLAVAGLLLRPTHGTVRIGGVDAGALSDKERTATRRTRLGFVFQQSNLIPSLTALEQLELMSHINGSSPRSASQRARELLTQVGLAAKADRRPHQLSGGERQRVGIARALVTGPDVILADEPTSALDHDRAGAVVELLAELTHTFGTATIMVTHDMRHLALTDRAVGIDRGELNEIATGADVLAGV
ncbi:MAG: ABC transporter ATP-binding protein [Acidimicrobiia bacterium]|nr:ABC transporter ATP-binding protein [Acidimicrobiia bacterium]